MTASRRADQRGIALLLVMWIFMLLGVLALDFARYMRDDAMAAVNLADETRGYYLALAGMHRALFDAKRALERDPATEPPKATSRRGPGMDPTEEDDEVRVPPDGKWHEDTFAGGKYAVRMTDEGGRISLNRANEQLLTRVVTNLVRGGNATTGVDRRTDAAISTIVDAILDWRDGDDLARVNGAESEYYLGLRTPYHAKNGLFTSPEELLLVKGMTPQLFYGEEGIPGLREVFSVFNMSKVINVKTAPAAVFQVLLDIDADATAALVEQRDSDPCGILETVRARVSEVDPSVGDSLQCIEPRIVMIEGRGDTTQERNQSRIAAVADVSAEASEGAKIIRWLDRAPWEGGLPTGQSERSRS